MNTKIAAIAIILIISAGLLVVMIPYVFPDSNTMTITFYNAKDEVVYSKSTQLTLVPLSFLDASGVEVTKVVITIDYNTEWTGESLSSISMSCDLTWIVRLNTTSSGIINGPITDSRTKTTETGTFEYTYYLSSVISPVGSTGKTYGWVIRFDVILTASATIDGESVESAPWTGYSYSAISWTEISRTLSITDVQIGTTPIA